VILGHDHLVSVLVDRRVLAHADGRSHLFGLFGSRRNHPVAALLRIHFAARAPRTQGTYMGFAFLPIGIGSLVADGSAAASCITWRSQAKPAPAGLVGDFRRGRPDRALIVDIRPRHQTWEGSDW